MKNLVNRNSFWKINVVCSENHSVRSHSILSGRFRLNYKKFFLIFAYTAYTEPQNVEQQGVRWCRMGVGWCRITPKKRQKQPFDNLKLHIFVKKPDGEPMV